MRAFYMSLLVAVGTACLAGYSSAREISDVLDDERSDESSSSERDKVKESIERVLRQDAMTTLDANAASRVVSRMRQIDTTECPNDFRAAYLAHIHAWEMKADVEREAAALESENQSDATLVESFIRGYFGDPLGKFNEINSAKARLQRDYQAASLQVKKSYQRVEEISISYGADPNQSPSGRSIRGTWQYAQAVDGKLVCGLYEFASDGTLTEYEPTGGRVSAIKGRWAREEDTVTIRWLSGAVEVAKISFLGDGHMVYLITSHSRSRSQIGKAFNMTPFNAPDQVMGVISIANKTPGEVKMMTRWVVASDTGSHEYTDWKESSVPSGTSWDFWCNGSYHAQIKFDRSLDPGVQEALYELPVNVVPVRDRPEASSGRRFLFKAEGGNGLELVVDDR